MQGRMPERDRVPARIRQRCFLLAMTHYQLYIKEQGAFIGKDGERLVVRHREAKTHQRSAHRSLAINALFGNVQMSSQALCEVVDRGIPVCHFSYGGWFVARPDDRACPEKHRTEDSSPRRRGQTPPKSRWPWPRVS